MRLIPILAVALCVLGRQSAGQAADDASQIRAARATSNKAIAAHDTLALSSVFLPDYISISSTNAESVGRDAARSRYAQLFKARPDVVFVRTADSIAVNREWDQAAELGHWTGRWTQPDGVTRVGGSYFAKWRKVNGRWMLLAES
ncbi:MAG TPA: nuclear transport factor 2 family protein, partial [Gemmatimonadaceae bacterium]